MDTRDWRVDSAAHGDGIRAADADRERVAELLKKNHAEGRLTDDEFEARFTESTSAKTLGELRALVADLPGAAPAPARGPWSRPRMPFPGRLVAAFVVVAVLLNAMRWTFFGWHGYGYHGYHHHWFPWPLVFFGALAAMFFRRRWAWSHAGRGPRM
jgi:hypothetical protein